jgi:cell wall-associated NlpC family hydrolase
MPSALVRMLAAPLRELQAQVGTGTPDTSVALSEVRRALAAVAAATNRSWRSTRWTGDAADAAAEFTDATVAAVEEMAARAERLGSATSDATAAVARARERLQAIIEEFEARAAALEPRLDEPGTADVLVAESRRALEEADDVIDELRGELDEYQTTVAEPASVRMPTLPMGTVGSGLGGSSAMGLAGAFRPQPEAPGLARDDTRPSIDPGVFGGGIGLEFPDGGMATAPNAVAASAVRHALTQLGVPYDWGGTTPGVGLDCSGLTQWAYREAGLDLPRLAQEQDVGTAVDRSALRPGDLAVWDGHVAMVVGNGLMIEAGDPVHLSAIRTSNAGQGFQGFWRPTA